MNNWRGNLHPRGGDSDHPGALFKGAWGAALQSAVGP